MVGCLMKKKETRNIYDNAITYENIYNMWRIIKRTCNNRKEVFYFSLNLNSNLYNIYNALKNKTYIPGKYRIFMIFEPKARLVMSQSIFDKIVNHFVTNYYLISYLDKYLIDFNVATRRNKGSSYAMMLLKKYFNKIIINEHPDEIYCLKIDISKYFYNIDHEILISMLEKKIYDKDVINLIKTILSETSKEYVKNKVIYYNNLFNTDIPIYRDGKGLSIGAMSSQFLAIFYLNDLDHYIKEELGCKYYIRYMDDMLVLDTSKERLKYIWKIIDEKINNLKLKSNKKSNIYRTSNGFIFLGFKYKYINNRLIISYNKKTYFNIRNKLNYLYFIDYMRYKKSLASYNGYFKVIGDCLEGDFRMKSIDLHNEYKKKYSDTIVFVKEGIFYNAYNGDGKILWYLFDYKYINNKASFGNNSYDKVLDKLRKLDINFVIVSKEGELLKFLGGNAYNNYLELSIRSYRKDERLNYLINKLKKIYYEDYLSFDEINKYFDSIL